MCNKKHLNCSCGDYQKSSICLFHIFRSGNTGLYLFSNLSRSLSAFLIRRIDIYQYIFFSVEIRFSVINHTFLCNIIFRRHVISSYLVAVVVVAARHSLRITFLQFAYELVETCLCTCEEIRRLHAGVFALIGTVFIISPPFRDLPTGRTRDGGFSKLGYASRILRFLSPLNAFRRRRCFSRKFSLVSCVYMT